MALALAGASGCGAQSPDLFAITRSGSLPGARLTLVANDGGTVRCNGGPARPITDPQLLDARDITSSVMKDAQQDLVLPEQPGTLLRFHLRDQDGTVTFSDIDAGRYPELAKAVAFTRTIATSVCHLAR